MFANFNLFLEWLPTHWQSTAEATYDAARWPRCETAPRTHTPRRSARTSRAVRHRLPRGTHRPRDGSRPVRRCPPPAVNLFTTMSDLRTHKQSIGFSRSSRIFWICGYIAYCIFSRVDHPKFGHQNWATLYTNCLFSGSRIEQTNLWSKLLRRDK